MINLNSAKSNKKFIYLWHFIINNVQCPFVKGLKVSTALTSEGRAFQSLGANTEKALSFIYSNSYKISLYTPYDIILDFLQHT